MAEPGTVTFTVSAGDGSGEKRTITIKQEGQFGIGIHLEGCGMLESGADDGFPIYIEFYDGKPRCLVWADIRDPDPTHVIEMDTALEKYRVPDEECDTNAET